jgi:hypothetical protein
VAERQRVHLLLYPLHETSVYIMMHVPNPEFMQTFGLREDVKKAREDAGADVKSTTIITQI